MERVIRMFVSILLFLCLMWVVHATLLEAPPTSQSGPQCMNWGVYEREKVRVYEGEAGRIHCPLFSHPKLYNYAQIQSTGHTLLWYRHTHELEEPVDLSLPTFVKHRDALWIQPASMQDRGEYICILRNMSSCVKIGVRLDVVPRMGDCDDTLHRNFSVPLQSNYTLRCPNVQHLPSKTYNVVWYHHCKSDFFDRIYRDVRNHELMIYQMFYFYVGPYTCVVTYQSNGHTLNYTHTITLRAVSNGEAKEPMIWNPAVNDIYTVSVGKDAKLACRAFLPYLNDEEPQVWWSINNKTLEELSEPRYSSPAVRVLEDDYGDRKVERILNVSPFKEEDLHKEFRCSVQNSKGFDSKVATLKEEVYIPSVELGCGLGVTLVLALLLFVLYRVFWLEVHLLYRSWFGTDERDTDGKEYDVYISYARDTEEEEFVMATLRRVLEAEFGYTVCIFDRDSLPGGTVTEETLQFVSRSRRLLVILSACSAFRDAQALLEVRAGVSAMLRGGSVKLVLVQFKTTHTTRDKSHKRDTHKCVKELRRARIALALVQWEGDKSTSLTSHFWKKLRLQLPVRTPPQTTKHTQDTSYTDEKQKSESTLLMLESLHMPNTHENNNTPKEHTDTLHKT
ncbi:interleukin-1 receptor accessory protein [Pangasianodon hypophthalmus]|uniref:interleukin-1 receptor accessory protein n=1 Tax=Pangasianodon hypophthalmus TaxID=310915 RepID=UPI002306E84B|nr:interleukin-1 receptor accessory protein [Pangasianodon hypophthalmus]